MTHVDYLCPICDARIGTARVGAYADPLDPVTCDRCHRKFHFHDLLPKWNAGLLRSSGFRPTIFGASPSFVADLGTTNDFGVTSSTVPGIVMASGQTLIVSVVHAGANDPESVTWNSTSLTKRQAAGTGIGSSPKMSMWVLDNCPAVTSSVVVGMAEGPSESIVNCYSIFGCATNSSDQSASGTGFSTAASTNFVTTTQPNEILFSTTGVLSASPPPITYGLDGFSVMGTVAGANLALASSWRQVTAIGSYRARSTFTLTLWTIGMITLKGESHLA